MLKSLIKTGPFSDEIRARAVSIERGEEAESIDGQVQVRHFSIFTLMVRVVAIQHPPGCFQKKGLCCAVGTVGKVESVGAQPRK